MRWGAFGCKVAEKTFGNNNHSNTKKSATAKERHDERVCFGAKLTKQLSANDGDEKSISSHRENKRNQQLRNQTPFSLNIL